MEAYVKASFDKGITSIEFFHPQSNSMPAALLQQLAERILEAGKDAATKTIVVKSAGEKAFCAGASFDELIAIKTEQEGLAFFSGFSKVINAMRVCPKLIIARIQGKCVGGGVGIAAAADYSIALSNSDIKLSELAVGIGPFVVGPVIQRKMGLSAFSQLAIDASNWRSAEWAKTNGLFSELHPTVEAVEEAVNKLASTLANSNPEAILEMKKIFWEGTDHWDRLLAERAAISGRLVLSDFTRNAIEKFKKK